LESNLPYLKQQYGVNSLAIFGSIAREQGHRRSDVDILVGFVKPPSLFALVQIESHLSKHLGKRVDLVMEDCIKPSFRQRISEDLIRI
jgi:predicted nucleotidyltransferase